MGLQHRINTQRKKEWVNNPSRIRFVACILCKVPGGLRGTSPLKKVKDPKTGDEVYFHMKGCPRVQ